MRTRKVALASALYAATLLAFQNCGSFEASVTTSKSESVNSPSQVTPTPAPAPTPVNAVSATFLPTTADIPNQERGWLTYGNDLPSSRVADLQAAFRRGERLVHSRTNIGAFVNSPISQAYLNSLNTGFAAYRSAHMKVGLRFQYSDVLGQTDATAAQIKAHLEQLKPVLKANADVIGFFDAGFIGTYGEWWYTPANGTITESGLKAGPSTAAKLTVRDALMANVPIEIPVRYRSPWDALMPWFPTPITAAQAFDGSTQSRTGFHNDCWFANESDEGTYLNRNGYTVAQEQAYARAVTEFVPFGGEVCGSSLAANRNPVAEAKAYHLTSVRNDWGLNIIAALKSSGAYATMSTYMGYRFQLDKVSLPSSANRGNSAAVTVSLRNVGYARIFSARNLVVILKNRTSGETIVGRAGDLRLLPSQATASTDLVINVAIPAGANVGAYDVYLSAPDVYTTTAAIPDYSVRFANADNAAAGQKWDATTGFFATGISINIL